MTAPTPIASRRDAWLKFESQVIGALIVLAIAIFLYGSIARSLAPSFAVDWTEEVTIYLTVWATLLTGGRLAADRDHIAAGMLLQRLPPSVRKRFAVGIDIITLGFAGCMFWLGIEGVAFTHWLDERSASTLQAPQAWVLYLALPVGMLMIVTRIAMNLAWHRSSDSA